MIPGSKEKCSVWDSIQQLANENKPKRRLSYLIVELCDSLWRSVEDTDISVRMDVTRRPPVDVGWCQDDLSFGLDVDRGLDFQKPWLMMFQSAVSDKPYCIMWARILIPHIMESKFSQKSCKFTYVIFNSLNLITLYSINFHFIVAAPSMCFIHTHK